VSSVNCNQGQKVFHEVRLAVLNLPDITKEFQDCVAVVKVLGLCLAVRDCNIELILDTVTGKHGLDRDTDFTAKAYTFKVYPIVACIPLVDEIAVGHDVYSSVVLSN
jgi:hypothetical protein